MPENSPAPKGLRLPPPTESGVLIPASKDWPINRAKLWRQAYVIALEARLRLTSVQGSNFDSDAAAIYANEAVKHFDKFIMRGAGK